MTTFINNNAVPCPDLLPNAPFATAAADNQAGLHLSYSFGTSPGGYIGIRADGTNANPTRLKNGDFIAVFGAGGYNGGSTNHGYTLGSAAVSMWADEDWSPAGTGTFISFDTRTRGVPGDVLALQRMHVTSDGITINDANGSEPTGGRLGAGTLNVAGPIAINGSPILLDPASFVPTDQSGAGLVFVSTAVRWDKSGNNVRVYGLVQYPVTASGANATISLPIAVPNQAYAQVPGACLVNSAVANAPVILPIANTSTAQFTNASTGVAYTNAQLSGAVARFFLEYPAS